MSQGKESQLSMTPVHVEVKRLMTLTQKCWHIKVLSILCHRLGKYTCILPSISVVLLLQESHIERMMALRVDKRRAAFI